MRVLLIAVTALLLCGCVSGNKATDNKVQFVTACEAYSTVVDSLTLLKSKGAFSVQDAGNITVAIHECSAFLERWKKDIDAGKDTINYYAEFHSIFDKLNAYLIAKESAGGK
jgi:hypothetical protein